MPPPAQCSGCGAALAGAERAGSWWSQVKDVRIITFVTEYLLPLLACPCCGKINAAKAPPWAYPGSVSYGPGINTAAVLLTSYGNVPAERTANLIGMLLGTPVSAGFVDLAAGARLPAGRRDHRDPVVLHRLLDQRRVLRLPAAPAAARRGAAVLPARHPALPRGHQAGALQCEAHQAVQEALARATRRRTRSSWRSLLTD